MPHPRLDRYLRAHALVLLLSLMWCVPSSVAGTPILGSEPVYANWTLEQQVGQLLIWGSTNRPDDLKHILEGDLAGPPVPIGGVLLTSKPDRKNADVRALAAYLRTAPQTPIAPLLCADQEGGKIAALREGVQVAPSALVLGGLPPEMIRQIVYQMARDTRAAGIDILLAPVVDVDGEPLNPAIGAHERSFGGDPQQVADAGLAYCLGVWDAGAVPVLKHFPGHGDAATDSHKTLPAVGLSRQMWMQREAIPYYDISAVRLHRPGPPPLGVMVGHLDWPALTGDHLPTGFSRSLIDGELRTALGLRDQVIWSDDLLMKALPDPVTSAIAMRKAGIDLLLVSREPATLRAIHQALTKYYRNGWLDRADLHASLDRILALKSYVAALPGTLPPDPPPSARPILPPTPFF